MILQFDETTTHDAGKTGGATLAEAFDSYYEPLYRYAYVHLRDRETAEDIAAQVFHRLLDAIHAGRPPTMLRAWLYQVARNLIADHARRQRFRNHAPLDDSLHLPGDVEGLAAHAIDSARVSAALTRLHPRQREVVILRYLQELSIEDTAAVLKISPGAVKQLQHRGLNHLRRILDDQNPTQRRRGAKG